MGKLNFKDFNYSLIDSIKKGYKEILVTYKADGQVARQYVFIKESHGKGSSYYISKAKENIKKSIESGELNKASKKQIRKVKHTGSALKPVLITLAGVVAAGSLVTGGYYLGNYLNGGNGGGGGGVVTTGHTVVLLAGEGTFEGDKTYLIFNNVKDGTALGDIEGYQIPTKNDYDFKWNGPIEGTPYGTSFKITEDIVLTADFFEGIKYLKSQAIQDIATELQDIKDGYGELITEEVFQLLQDIFTESKEAINKIEGSDDPTVSDDARNTINDLRKYAIDTLAESGVVAAEGQGALEKIRAIKLYYSTSLNTITKETNIVKRAAITKFDGAYVQAMYNAPDTTLLEATYDKFKTELENINFEEPQGVLRARLLSYSGNAAIAGSGYFKDARDTEKNVAKIMEISNMASEKLIEANVSPDDTVTIDWMGDIVRNKCYAELKYRYYDPNPHTEVPSYDEYITTLTDNNITAAIDYITGKDTSKETLIDINLKSSIAKALANVKILGKSYFTSEFPSITYFKGSVEVAYNIINEAIGKMNENAPEFDEVANKLTKCFSNALEAFSIWVGNKEVDTETEANTWSYDWLFARSMGKGETTGTIYNAIATAIDVDGKVLDEAVLLDAYVTLTEKAIDIAKIKEYDIEGKNPSDYTLLSDGGDGLEFSIITQLKEAVTGNQDKFASIDKKEYYKTLLPAINQAIVIGIDANYSCMWAEGIFLSYIEEDDAGNYAIVSSDMVDFLTTCYLGTQTSACALFNKAHEIIEDFSDVSVPVSEYFDGINSTIKSFSDAIVKKFAEKQPNATVGLGELINDFLVTGIINLYNLYEVPTTYDELSYIMGQIAWRYGDVFSGLHRCLSLSIGSVIPDKDSLYMTFYDTMREMLETIPTLGLDCTKIMLGSFSAIGNFFGQALDKSNELKAAIEDNLIDVISPGMEAEEFKIIMNNTVNACEEIVSPK